MNKSRSRHKIYFLIDLFFLSFPFIVLVFGGLVWLVGVSRDTGLDFTSTNFFTLSNQYFTDFNNNILNFVSGHTGFGYQFINFLNSVVSVLFDNDFIHSSNYIVIQTMILYIGYITCYEFLSLFINVVLWIPRTLRDFFQNKTNSNL